MKTEFTALIVLRIVYRERVHTFKFIETKLDSGAKLILLYDIQQLEVAVILLLPLGSSDNSLRPKRTGSFMQN